MWFATMIDTYDSQNLEDLMYTEFDRHQNNNDSSLNTFMLHLLQKADINISNSNYESIKREVNQLPFELPPELQGLMNPIPSAKKVLEQRRIVTSHQVVENGEKKEYPLNYFDESNGTKSTLLYTITCIIKMLHPFMPFVTEEIYSNFEIKDTELLLQSEYPTYNKKQIYNDITKEIDNMLEYITLFRNKKLENKISNDIEIIEKTVVCQRF